MWLKQHNDDVARIIKLYLICVSVLPSADCEYHVHCYNRFMKIPKYADLPTGSVDENTLKQVIECINVRSTMHVPCKMHSKYICNCITMCICMSCLSTVIMLCFNYVTTMLYACIMSH